MVLTSMGRAAWGMIAAAGLALATLATLAAGAGDAAIAAVTAGALQVTPSAGRATASAYLEGGAAWQGIPEVPVPLNRTPPLYEGDPLDDGYRPAAQLALVRTAEGLFVRLRWEDATESRPQAAERVPDGGEGHIYKEHSLDIDRFADAACVMVPKPAGPLGAFPSLMMGEKGLPVELYYWHEVRGFQRLEAAGRSTTTRTGEAFPGAVRRTVTGWEAVFQLPALPPQAPIALAVWDGARGQRDGLKYFSLWYEVGP